MVRTRRAINRNRNNGPGNFELPTFGEASGGLVPVWNTGFYVTPDEPADPRDCERYPDSPYCGSNPFTSVPGGLDPEIVLDECDIGIRLNPSLGFVRLPPVSFVYRRPECRNQPENRERNLPDDYSSHPPLPNCPTNRDSYVLAIVCPIRYYRYVREYTSGDPIVPAGSLEVERTETFEVLDFTYPYNGEDKRCFISHSFYQSPNERNYEGSRIWGYSEQLLKPIIYLKIKRTVRVESNDLYKQFIQPDYDGYGYYHKADPFSDVGEYENTETFDIYLTADAFTQPQLNFSYEVMGLRESINPFPLDLSEKDKIHSPGISIRIGNCESISSGLQQVFAGTQTYESGLSASVYEIQYECIFKYFNIQLPSPTMPDSCCPDDLLRLLIQKVDRLSEVVGVDEYPAYVPESFISEFGGFLDELLPTPTVQIPSLTKLFEWYVKRFDELMGQWKVAIEVKDSDPTKSGDQKLSINLPNIAEAIAEMMLLLLQISINSETLLNMNTRTMIEVGQDKQQNFKSYMLIDAIADYLGFKYEEKKHKLPMLFTINKDEYDQLLKETETEVVAAEYTDKQNFQETLHRLLEGAAITKAANFRKLNVNGDMVKQIVDLIKNYSKINKQSDQNDDFDTFIENAEIGFTNTPGVTDTTHPYGRDYSQRPRIREVDDTTEQG